MLTYECTEDSSSFPEFGSKTGVGISPQYLGSMAVVKVRRWLHECLSEHETCQKYSGKASTVPKRLIDVGNSFTSPFLHDLNGNTVKYVTLSYCWGNSWNSMTTTSNIDARMSKIPLDDLSPTLRQAILLTRRLGVRYIWIDALCIIQDSSSEWQEESIKMGDIYRNSVLTIAASRSQSSLGGIIPDFTDRAPTLMFPVQGREELLLIDTIPLSWNTSVEDDALSSRGWVLQERLLSCRTVFFDRHQLFWECKTRRASQLDNHLKEENNNLEEDNSSTVNEQASDEIPKSFSLNHLAMGRPAADYTNWYGMLDLFSQKSLTIPSDRLPALAGMAKSFQLDDELYVAGTWMRDWMRGLCWQAASPRSLREPVGLAGSRAPSWSWAKLDGEIQHFLDWNSQNLQLKAKLLSTNHDISDFLGTQHDITLEIEGFTEWVNARSSTTRLEPPSSYNCWVGTYDDVTKNWEYRLDQVGQEEECMCLRLLLCCIDLQMFKRGTAVCLLLQPTDESHLTWRRIGFGHADSYMVDFSKLGNGGRRKIFLV
jgi:hypothetical protein